MHDTRDNSRPIQVRITKFRPEVQNNLVKIPIVLGVADLVKIPIVLGVVDKWDFTQFWAWILSAQYFITYSSQDHQICTNETTI